MFHLSQFGHHLCATASEPLAIEDQVQPQIFVIDLASHSTLFSRLKVDVDLPFGNFAAFHKPDHLAPKVVHAPEGNGIHPAPDQPVVDPLAPCFCRFWGVQGRFCPLVLDPFDVLVPFVIGVEQAGDDLDLVGGDRIPPSGTTGMEQAGIAVQPLVNCNILALFEFSPLLVSNPAAKGDVYRVCVCHIK